jgi:hypothetical protein
MVTKIVDFTGKNPFASRIPSATVIKGSQLVKDDVIMGARVLSILSRTKTLITVETDQGTLAFNNHANLRITR